MAYFQENPLSNAPKRSNDDYLNPSRMESVNHMKTEIKKEPNHTIGDFFFKIIMELVLSLFQKPLWKKGRL